MQLPKLSDGHVLLRATDGRDMAAIEVGIHDPDVIRWIGPQLPTAADVLAQDENYSRHGSPTLAICEPDGTFIGKIWLSVIDTDRSTASIGYWLLPAARGRGLATNAVGLLSKWAVDEFGISNLRISTAPGNERSQRVAERSGFRLESSTADEVVYVRPVVRHPRWSGR